MFLVMLQQISVTKKRKEEEKKVTYGLNNSLLPTFTNVEITFTLSSDHTAKWKWTH